MRHMLAGRALPTRQVRSQGQTASSLRGLYGTRQAYARSCKSSCTAKRLSPAHDSEAQARIDAPSSAPDAYTSRTLPPAGVGSTCQGPCWT